MPTLLQILLLRDDHALEEMTTGPRQREKKDLASRVLVWCHFRLMQSVKNAREFDDILKWPISVGCRTLDSRCVKIQTKFGAGSALVMATTSGSLDGALDLSRAVGPTADCRRISARETRTSEPSSASKLINIEQLLDREGVSAIAKESQPKKCWSRWNS